MMKHDGEFRYSTVSQRRKVGNFVINLIQDSLPKVLYAGYSVKFMPYINKKIKTYFPTATHNQTTIVITFVAEWRSFRTSATIEFLS